jgi:LemA protein
LASITSITSITGMQPPFTGSTLGSGTPHPDAAYTVGIAPTGRRSIMKVLRYVAIMLAASLMAGCGYNTLQQQDEQVKSAWSEVLNQYQRRADLVPNLVNTVKGAVQAERDILDSVVSARSRATSIQATPELINDPAAFQKWQAAQGELSSALSRLMVVVERYPDLKSISGFQDLRAQLEGTENRITVARKRYIDSVQAYNVTVRQFPSNLTAKMFGHDVRPNFTVENEAQISRPPTVDFGTGSAQAPAPSTDQPVETP